MVQCLDYTALVTGHYRSPPDYCLATESKTRSPECGCFENQFLKIKKCGQPMTVCLSEEMKILARKQLGKSKAIEVSVPYRPRVGDAEIHTWGDGWKNFKFLFAKRVGLNRTKTPWGSRDSNPDSINNDLPEQ